MPRTRSNFLTAIAILVSTIVSPTKIDAQDSIEQWNERQQKIKDVIRQVRPCVVAIEGGSGVIVSQQGHILSVSHVTRFAGRQVDVLLADGTISKATTLGSDFNLDIGLLKFDESRKWPFMSVSDLSIPGIEDDVSHSSANRLNAKKVVFDPRSDSPSTPRVDQGTWCLAFGYPLSFQRGAPAVTRLGQVLMTEPNLIVTSATIMGGDSGGPLVDLEGRLMGICSRVKTDVDKNLHIPIKSYCDRWEQLLSSVDVEEASQIRNSDEQSSRPWLGILGDTDNSRVRVRQVLLGSPADKAGLKPEDVIIFFDQEEVKSFSEVVEHLRRLHPGDKITLQVNRYGNIIDLTAELGRK